MFFCFILLACPVQTVSKSLLCRVHAVKENPNSLQRLNFKLVVTIAGAMFNITLKYLNCDTVVVNSPLLLIRFLEGDNIGIELRLLSFSFTKSI